MAGRVWLGVTKQGYINETEEGLVGGGGRGLIGRVKRGEGRGGRTKDGGTRKSWGG